MMRKLLLFVRFLFLQVFNLTSKKIFNPSLVMLCLGMFFVVSFANAAEYFSISSGNWTNRNTWSTTSGGPRVGSGVFPVAGDIVHIEGGFVVTLSANAACATIDFPTTNNDNSIVLNGYTLNVSGNISLPRSGNTMNLINVGSGTLNAGSIDFPTTGSAVRHKITISTGTVVVSGNISTNSPTATSATIEFTGSGLLRVGGDLFSSGGGSLTQSTGTVELNGVNQSFKAFTFYNLTLSGSGTKSFTGTTSVANVLQINSGVIANLGSQTHTANTLNLGATQVMPSSWGSTGSTATNKSDVYFTSTASGIINVTSSTCANFSSVSQITSVSLNNTARTSTGTTGYEDLTSPVLTTVTKGQSYALVVRGNTNGDQNVFYSAFFDWNNDGTFAYPGEYFQIGPIRNSAGTTADG